MSIITVSNAAELLRALKAAQDGDVIQLEPGTYSSISIKNLNFGNVTIESKDPDHPAVLTEVFVKGSSGLTFHDLEVAVDPKRAGQAFQVHDSKNIQLDGLNVHGTLNGDPMDDKSGLLIRNSRNVSVTNSEFQQLTHALEQLDNDHLVITNNSFHDIRTDAIRGGGTSDVLIARNLFKDFYPAPGDHGDAIQFWTTNTTASASNIVITENVILRGVGGVVQGIFFRDQVGDLPYENVVITDNLVVGMMYNGIMVDGGRHVTVTGNIVEALPDMKSWIRLQSVVGATLTDNEAFTYIKTNSSEIFDQGNHIRDYANDGGLSTLTAWLKDHGPVGIHGDGLVLPEDPWGPPDNLPDLPPSLPDLPYDVPGVRGHDPMQNEPSWGEANGLMIAHGFGFAFAWGGGELL